MRRSVLLLALLSHSACDAEDVTALRLRLVFDPELQSERQILSAVERLELVLDASGGFAGLSAAGQRVGELSAADPDGDGVLELVLTRALKGQAALPLLRLLPGKNGNRAFQITARGLAGSELAAFGGLGAVRFAQGASLDVLVPFNLRPAFLPPRVLFTLPHDGETRAPGALGQIYLELSKQVTPESAKAGLRLVYQGTAGDVAVPGSWVLGENQIDDLGLPTRRTTATFQPGSGCTLSAGSYRIEAAATIVDLAGKPLDQKADTDGPDPYLGRFTIPGAAEADSCAKTPTSCKRDEDCGELVLKQYVCNLATGQCVLGAASCPTLACPKGYVCQPAGTPGASSKCVQDCRIAGTCAGAQDSCDPATGLCLPCDAKSVDPKCGAVSEEVTCLFDGTALEQKCSSTKGSCSGFGSCAVKLAGTKGELVTWSSSCGGADQTTTIDGTDKKLVFKCTTTGTPVQEQVKCVFGTSTLAQDCYSDVGPSCKGIGSCLVKVSGMLGQKVLWKSSCGGYVTTLLDGKDESATFACK